MKETRYFYAPDASASTELPSEEAGHALRVLRLGLGDELLLADGRGCFYRAIITAATGHRCTYRIEESLPQEPAWMGHLHLAMAPTKLMDRTEWFAEKATEIGFDELTFLDCQFSERRVIKEERVDKILVSAMKQSHKAWKPTLNSMVRFREFITQEREGDKFICHCYDENDIEDGGAKPLLFDVIREGVPTTVLVGPEGDFSVEEVRLALQNGYKSVSLGRSRLRTETAALVAVHMMHLKNENYTR
ncbi:MAG: 16S rRNA (uracil(1498)-N(3))-methyltransferase [Bacteroidaceae bacterium]|jgi:16S rRNA (uracil1498-N3)-methyltransferase|nr:16S rRNA (uracil(1498)-N(3))-methyltransferase [Bacteroidaceae bacterium]